MCATTSCFTSVLEQVRHYIVLKTAICVGVGFVVGLIFSLLRVEVSGAAIGLGRGVCRSFVMG